MNNIWIGIDPGSSTGSICIFIEGDNPQYKFLRFSKMTEVEIVDELKKVVFKWRTSDVTILAVLEKVNAMPGQGVTSMFTFGENYGWIRGVLLSLGIPFLEHRPSQWMKAMWLTKSKDEEKTAFKRRRKIFIEKLHPGVKLLNDTFDSLILAEYARQKQSSYGSRYKQRK